MSTDLVAIQRRQMSTVFESINLSYQQLVAFKIFIFMLPRKPSPLLAIDDKGKPVEILGRKASGLRDES